MIKNCISGKVLQWKNHWPVYLKKYLALADTSGTRKREHDTRALKRLEIETLRQSAPKGRKVIYVWDRAGIDFFQWFEWKHIGGIYFISREKKNMYPLIIGELYYDKKNPVNKGVQKYQIIGTSAGVMMHRVVYKCPVSGESYHFDKPEYHTTRHNSLSL